MQLHYSGLRLHLESLRKTAAGEGDHGLLSFSRCKQALVLCGTERSTCCTRDRAPSVREVDKWERVREWQRVCDLDKLMASHVTAPSLRWRLVPTQRWLPSA